LCPADLKERLKSLIFFQHAFNFRTEQEKILNIFFEQMKMLEYFWHNEKNVPDF
jgi:hypothetical protein